MINETVIIKVALKEVDVVNYKTIFRPFLAGISTTRNSSIRLASFYVRVQIAYHCNAILTLYNDAVSTSDVI